MDANTDKLESPEAVKAEGIRGFVNLLCLVYFASWVILFPKRFLGPPLAEPWFFTLYTNMFYLGAAALLLIVFVAPKSKPLLGFEMSGNSFTFKEFAIGFSGVYVLGFLVGANIPILMFIIIPALYVGLFFTAAGIAIFTLAYPRNGLLFWLWIIQFHDRLNGNAFFLHYHGGLLAFANDALNFLADNWRLFSIWEWL